MHRGDKVAQRRMFSMKIIDTDLFLDMPVSSQLLYFHLSMRADDDGFISSPKKIMKMVNCSEDDLKVLEAKQFVIPFDNGICVITHWRIHNYIQKDRYSETMYLEEKQSLDVDDNGAYTKCIQNVYNLDTQVRLGKGSKGKGRLEEGKESKETIQTLIDAYASPGGELNKTILDYIEMRTALKKKPTPRALKMIFTKLDKLANDEYTKIKILEQSILKSWTDVYELKEHMSSNSNNPGVNQKMQGLNNWINGRSTK